MRFGYFGRRLFMKRTDRLIQEKIHDPYYEGKKYAEPTVCNECQLVYDNGRRMQKDHMPENPNTQLCLACRRIKDRCPGGCLYLSGKHFKTYRKHILNLVNNIANQVRNTHPARRIMWQRSTKTGLEIATTDGHWARRPGDAIDRFQKGTLDLKYADDDRLVRVYWCREE
jgi:hypothetical protein